MKILLAQLLVLLVTNVSAQDVVFDWVGSIAWADGFSGEFEIDSDGNIYNVGTYYETVDFDFGPSNYTLTNNGTAHQYIQKMTTDGDLIWAYSLDGMPRSMALDSLDNLYVLGDFSYQSDFDPGHGVENVVPNGIYDAFLLKIDPNGNFVWVKIISGPQEIMPSDIAIEHDNIYFIGAYEGTVDFDPSANVYARTAIGNTDLFIQKMDLDGNYIWTKFIEGASSIVGERLVVDNSGNVCLTGRFYEDFDFDPSAASFVMTSAMGAGTPFLEKLTPNGDFLWAKPIVGFSGFSTADYNSVRADGSDNLYLFGTYSTMYSGGNGTFYSNPHEGFVHKLDANGNFLWEKTVGGDFATRIMDGVLDEYGDIYFTGFFLGTNDFDPSSADYLLTSNGSNDIFVEKLAANGDFVWAMSYGGTGYDLSRSIKMNDEGDLFVRGEFKSIDIDFDPSDGHAIVTSPTGCANTFIQKFSQPTLTLSENTIERDFLMYPNPSSGKVNMDITSSETSQLVVTDVQGRVCYEDANFVSGKHLVNLDLKPGMYSVQVSNAKGRFIRQLIVQ